MAKGINKVILVGNLGNDPETKYLPSGGAVTNISLATADSYKDKNTGQQVDKTEWHKIVFFGKLAEIAGEYLRKGSQVYIEGKLQTRKWQDQQGQDKYITEIVVDQFDGKMQMLGSKGDNQNQGAQQNKGGGFAPAPQPQGHGGFNQPQPQNQGNFAPQNQGGGFNPQPQGQPQGYPQGQQ